MSQQSKGNRHHPSKLDRFRTTRPTHHSRSGPCKRHAVLQVCDDLRATQDGPCMVAPSPPKCYLCCRYAYRKRYGKLNHIFAASRAARTRKVICDGSSYTRNASAQKKGHPKAALSLSSFELRALAAAQHAKNTEACQQKHSARWQWYRRNRCCCVII